MVKDTKVKIHAPFMDIPIGHNGKDVTVFMDRRFMNDLIDYVQKQNF